MVAFLTLQYHLNKIGVAELNIAVSKGWITEIQKEAILNI